jgi:hypothetical protein
MGAKKKYIKIKRHDKRIEEFGKSVRALVDRIRAVRKTPDNPTGKASEDINSIARFTKYSGNQMGEL